MKSESEEHDITDPGIARRETAPGDPEDFLREARTENGISIADQSATAPVLLIFLRHSGCTFCRQTLSDLARVRTRIEAAGVKIVVVHMSPPSEFTRTLDEYSLADVQQISDPGRLLYRGFGLHRGSAGQLLGWRVWWNGFLAAIIQRHGAGRVAGDARQMPGLFLIRHGRVMKEFRHTYSSDRPDLLAFISSEPRRGRRE